MQHSRELVSINFLRTQISTKRELEIIYGSSCIKRPSYGKNSKRLSIGEFKKMYYIHVSIYDKSKCSVKNTCIMNNMHFSKRLIKEISLLYQIRRVTAVIRKDCLNNTNICRFKWGLHVKSLIRCTCVLI